jgi:hypothetical protein
VDEGTIMTVVIKSHGLVGSVIQEGSAGSGTGYVKSYDPSAHVGRGEITFTNDIDEALKLRDVNAAFDFIYQTPTERPVRADGEPNQPITAFHLEIFPLPN